MLMLMLLMMTRTAAQPAIVLPVCTVASHDVLMVQTGRDVCAAPRNAQGRPRAMGFLPTQCARAEATYRIDARGRNDLCLGGR